LRLFCRYGAGPRVASARRSRKPNLCWRWHRLIGEVRVELADTTPVIPYGVVTTQPDHSPSPHTRR